MADPLGVSASVVGIATAAIQSVHFIHTTTGDIKDVLTALRRIRSDLQALEGVLQKLFAVVEGGNSETLSTGNIEAAIKDCNSACSKFQQKLVHWTGDGKQVENVVKTSIDWHIRAKNDRCLQRAAQRLQKHTKHSTEYLICVILCQKN